MFAMPKHFTFFSYLMMVDLMTVAFSPPPMSRQLSCLTTKITQDASEEAMVLIPSQVLQRSSNTSQVKQSTKNSTSYNESNLIPSQVRNLPKSTSRKPSSVSPSPDGNDSETSTAKNFSNYKKKEKKPIGGNLPDVHWRSISMEHLRLHPHFEPLPETVLSLEKLEDVSQFRQESWQWETLHRGRCTTSQVAAALGFLEPNAASTLDIPPSLRRGGLGAYYRLKEEPQVQTLEEMKEVLIESNDNKTKQKMKQPNTTGKKVWSIPTNGGKKFPFAAKYNIRMTSDDQRQRRVQASRRFHGMSTRMNWGNAQEATSVLTALNYFWKHVDTDIVVKEVGMCGAGLSCNTTSTSGLLLGATPDALLRYSNGTVEALEVKNHCPFYSPRRAQRKNSKENKRPRNVHNFFIRSFPFREPYMPTLYVSQLQMEMLCVGEHCQSAVMVRQTATNGALVLRLKRDSAWIDEMTYWLQRFHTDFVNPEIPPPENFFWSDKRHKAFVKSTLALAKTVEVLDHVPHKYIQRMLGTNLNTTSMFLD